VKLQWMKLTTSVSLFMLENKKKIRRVYWPIIILVTIVFAVGPIYLRLRNPDVIVFSAGALTAADFSELNRVMTLYMRESGRLRDFQYLGNHMWMNYPFIEMAERAGADFINSWASSFEELELVAGDNPLNVAFVSFIDEYFFDGIGRYGGLRVVQESANLAPWLVQPYFFGLHDWRFDDDRANIDVRDANFHTETLAAGVAYMSIDSFLTKGYEHVTRRPFRYFMPEEEQIRVLDFFESINDYEHLVIDIRGQNAGFGAYFLPLLLVPNISESHSVGFHAFHTDGAFALGVSEAFRSWYDFGELSLAPDLAGSLPYARSDDFERLIYGFAGNLSAHGSGEAAFGGTIWLLTDSCNFSGPNQLYLSLAQDAGFRIIYEANPESDGWVTSFARLSFSGLALRYNPLYFTDNMGRSLEEFTLRPDFVLTGGRDALLEVAEILALD